MARILPGARLAAVLATLLVLSGAPLQARAADQGGPLGDAEGALKELSKLFDSLSRALPEGKALAVGTLAQVITEAHERAAPSAQPVPSEIRSMLAPYFPETPWVLDKARWVVADQIGGLPDIIMLNPDVGAMTAGDIVIFRAKADAEGNASLWAHELVHVLQFQALGIEAFAREYLETGGRDLEREAEDFGERVRLKLETNKPIQSRDDRAPAPIG